MTTALSPVTLTRLEKAAVDNGFDQELPREGDWLGFASTQRPLRIWLGILAHRDAWTARLGSLVVENTIWDLSSIIGDAEEQEP